MRVLITGAASGFGRAVADELRRRGEDVRGIDIQPGPDVIVADVRDQDCIASAVSQAVRELDGLDVLINNAGIGEPVDAGAPPDERAVATIETNLLGVWRVTAAALPALIATHGRVINVASGLSFVNLPFTAAYSASKRGVAAYSDVLRLEYGDRIDVITVYPGYVRTAIHVRSEQMGLSLADAIPEEPIAGVVKTILRACYGRPPREMSTSLATAAGIFLGRHLPRITDWAVRQRMRRVVRTNPFDGAPHRSSGC